VRRWLNEVANARTHATTRAVPAGRWQQERERLLALPPPYPRQHGTVERLTGWRTVPPLQHPLSLYDALGAIP